MNVAGLSVNGQDAGNLGNFINSDGTQIPSYAGGSIDALSMACSPIPGWRPDDGSGLCDASGIQRIDHDVGTAEYGDRQPAGDGRGPAEPAEQYFEYRPAGNSGSAFRHRTTPALLLQYVYRVQFCVGFIRLSRWQGERDADQQSGQERHYRDKPRGPDRVGNLFGQRQQGDETRVRHQRDQRRHVFIQPDRYRRLYRFEVPDWLGAVREKPHQWRQLGQDLCHRNLDVQYGGADAAELVDGRRTHRRRSRMAAVRERRIR